MTARIGDSVLADAIIYAGSDQVAARTGERGIVTELGAADNFFEIQWDRTHMMTVVHASEFTVVTRAQPRTDEVMPEPELPPAMGWYAALAEEHIRLASSNLVSRSADGHLMIANVYARLELAAATDRSNNR